MQRNSRKINQGMTNDLSTIKNHKMIKIVILFPLSGITFAAVLLVSDLRW